MQNPSNQMPKEKKDHSSQDAVLRRIKSILLDHLGTKIVAILIAVALWAGLITQDPALTRERVFNDVTVSINSADTLKRNGFIVLEDVSAVLDDVTIRVNVPQAQYASVQASNYNVRVDLSRIREAGVQEVRIMATNSTNYGTVTEIDPPTVTLTVEEYVTRYRIPVMVKIEGEAPKGFYATEPAMDPAVVAVSGPKSLVERIACAQVTVDQTTLPAAEGDSRRALAFALLDENGDMISNDMIQVTSESVLLDSIIVSQTLYASREVELSELGLVTGKPADGYEIKGVYITPSTVTIAGREAAIRDMNILYAESTVNVNGMSSSVSKQLRVRQPSTIKYASTDMINIAVEIGPVITTHAFDVRVDLQGLSPALKEAGGIRMAAVHITGAKPWLNSLSLNDIELTCDLGSIAEPGTYTMPITCTVKNSEGQAFTYEIAPTSIVVTVIQR